MVACFRIFVEVAEIRENVEQFKRAKSLKSRFFECIGLFVILLVSCMRLVCNHVEI